MTKLFDKVLNFVGWEVDEEEPIEEQEETKETENNSPFQYNNVSTYKKQQQNKVVNIHASNQMKVVIVQPETYDDAQAICDHLKNKKPVIINLEEIEKESARRIIDFLSGSVYALEGSIQKVASGIFLVVPNNVDIVGDFREEFRSRSAFPWMK